MSRNLKILRKIIISLAIIIILLGFTETANMVTGNWYQQFLPNINGRQINDVFFLDSLTGYAVTNNLSPNDTGYILKTTNGGDNWSINLTLNKNLKKVKFINSNTGFVSGGSGGGTAYLTKTTNAGSTWLVVPSPGATSWLDMSVLNIDTIWVVDGDNIVGGVFRTTNGGINWTTQTGPSSHIYMFNARIGFADGLKRTSNSGVTWTTIPGEPSLFFDMHFTDSLTGWKSSGQMKKTTDGGFNWLTQTLPSGGTIITSQVNKFSNINKDTIWGVGGTAFFPGSGNRGILYRTTNGGSNWLYQIPDTGSVTINVYFFCQFLNKRIGWAYHPLAGIHTTNGGDTTFLVGIKQISNSVPKEFKLFQNYPNPFNPSTNIKYQISKSKYVNLIVYDIAGREIMTLVNQQQRAGTYQVDFSGNNLSSGVYFYSLFIGGVLAGVKKMILLK